MHSRRTFLQAAGARRARGLVVRQDSTHSRCPALHGARRSSREAGRTLRAIDAIGYREIEGTQGLLEKIVPALAGTQLKPVSLHLDSKVVTQGSEDDLARVLDTVKKAGFTFAVMPYLPPNERGGLDVIKKLAETLNRAGRKCREAGLRLCYHNHAFEFEPMGGSTPFETLMTNTDPKLVALEMDLFWVSVGGQDVVATLARQKGRTPLVHLKDKAADTANRYNEQVPRTAFKEVGAGTMDWPKILKACEAAGVEHYFVEQDQTPGDPVESLRQSYAFVSKLNY